MGQAGESISNKFTGKRGWLTTWTEQRQGITLDQFTALCNVGEGFEKVSISHASAWCSGHQARIDNASSTVDGCTCTTQPEHECDQWIRQRHFTAATSWTHRTCGTYGRCQQGSRKDRRRVRRWNRLDKFSQFSTLSFSTPPHAESGVSVAAPLLGSNSTYLSISPLFSVSSAVSSCHDTPFLVEFFVVCCFTFCFLIHMF
jgi:hypothetical protein